MVTSRFITGSPTPRVLPMLAKLFCQACERSSEWSQVLMQNLVVPEVMGETMKQRVDLHILCGCYGRTMANLGYSWQHMASLKLVPEGKDSVDLRAYFSWWVSKRVKCVGICKGQSQILKVWSFEENHGFHSYVILLPRFPAQNRGRVPKKRRRGYASDQALGWFSEVRAEMAPDVATCLDFRWQEDQHGS